MTKIGLVGHGAWGQYILRDLLSLGADVLVADTSLEACNKALENGASGISGNAEALPECAGYVVAVPIPQLAPVTASLLNRKRPVFCEKTMLLSESDYTLLKDLGGNELVFAMHKWHYHPGIEALRAVAATPRLGKIRQISTFRYHWVRDFHGGDVFWTQGVHDLTIVKHILGYIPDRIEAVKAILNKENLPVTFTAMLGDDPSVSLSVSGAHCYKRSGVTIHGESGTAGLHDAYDDFITIRDINGEERVPIDTTFPLYLELKEFTGFLNGGDRPVCGLEGAWEVSRAILNLREKAGIG